MNALDFLAQLEAVCAVEDLRQTHLRRQDVESAGEAGVAFQHIDFPVFA